MADPVLTITDHPEIRRYEARLGDALGDALAGFVEYRLAGGRRILLHTDVPPAFAGRGIGAALARHIFDEARAGSSRLTVKCPFIRSWLDRHPEYRDLVTPDGIVSR